MAAGESVQEIVAATNLLDNTRPAFQLVQAANANLTCCGKGPPVGAANASSPAGTTFAKLVDFSPSVFDVLSGELVLNQTGNVTTFASATILKPQLSGQGDCKTVKLLSTVNSSLTLTQVPQGKVLARTGHFESPQLDFNSFQNYSAGWPRRGRTELPYDLDGGEGKEALGLRLNYSVQATFTVAHYKNVQHRVCFITCFYYWTCDYSSQEQKAYLLAAVQTQNASYYAGGPGAESVEELASGGLTSNTTIEMKTPFDYVKITAGAATAKIRTAAFPLSYENSSYEFIRINAVPTHASETVGARILRESKLGTTVNLEVWFPASSQAQVLLQTPFAEVRLAASISRVSAERLAVIAARSGRAGEKINATASVTFENGSPVEGRLVKFTLPESAGYDAMTNGSGLAVASFLMPEGQNAVVKASESNGARELEAQSTVFVQNSSPRLLLDYAQLALACAIGFWCILFGLGLRREASHALGTGLACAAMLFVAYSVVG
jgi:hypothetical protein